MSASRVGLACWLLCGSLSAATHWVTLRSDPKSSEAGLFPPIACQVKEFDNGNTFVVFEENLHHQDLYVRAPDTLNADDLMELLIKLRTARDLGARKIVVWRESTKIPVHLPVALPFEELIQLAGATHVQTAKEEARELSALPSRRPRYYPEESVVCSSLYPELGRELASGLNVSFHTEAKSIQGKQVFLVAPALPPVNANFFHALKEIRLLSEQQNRVVWVSPYLPYARSDKVDQPGVTATVKLIADLAEWAGISTGVFVRMHAAQSSVAFSVPTLHVSSEDTINPYLRDKNVDVIVSPDTGFQKTATLHAKALGVPVVVINKVRDVKTGETRLYEMSGMDLTGLRVAIIDDETASGSTLADVARFLKARGAIEVYAVVTHLNGPAKKALASGDIDRLVVTNSFPIPAELDVERLSISKELVVALRPLMGEINSCRNALGEP